jgi:predicted metalloprotease
LCWLTAGISALPMVALSASIAAPTCLGIIGSIGGAERHSNRGEPTASGKPRDYLTARKKCAGSAQDDITKGRSMRYLLSVVVVAVTLLAPGAVMRGAAQGSQDDVNRDRANAAATATEILRLAGERKFNAMYDYMHPDAMAVVPRSAAVGVFTDVYAEAQAGQAQITGVEMVPWTWGVTGTKYPYAAKISFVQPIVDENSQQTWLEDDMYLVQSGGEWRWFFGSSAEAVQQAIETYGQQSQPITEGDLIQNVVDDLDAFYADVLSYTATPYHSPRVVLVSQGDRVNTGCGPATPGFYAFYCPPDQTIYLEEAKLLEIGQTDEFIPAFVIAHEWAHHVQDSVGLERVGPGDRPNSWEEVYSIELELMADCMSGAWAQDLDSRGALESGDIDATVDFTVNTLGDPGFIAEYDPQAHGSGAQRSQSILIGYSDGFLGCNIVI